MLSFDSRGQNWKDDCKSMCMSDTDFVMQPVIVAVGDLEILKDAQRDSETLKDT